MPPTSDPQLLYPHLSETPSGVEVTLDAILSYLERDLPNYPFDARLDAPFVREILTDYPGLDVLEEIKMLRWYYNNRPPFDRQPRAYVRRWMARAARIKR